MLLSVANHLFTANEVPIWYRVTPRDFNSYGSRRGNDEIMSRGTFANIRLVNKFMTKAGPQTIHIPSNQEVSLYCVRVPKHENYVLFLFS